MNGVPSFNKKNGVANELSEFSWSRPHGSQLLVINFQYDPRDLRLKRSESFPDWQTCLLTYLGDLCCCQGADQCMSLVRYSSTIGDWKNGIISMGNLVYLVPWPVMCIAFVNIPMDLYIRPLRGKSL